MLDGNIFDTIDFISQQVRGNCKPFGGIQVIAVGTKILLK